MAKASELLRYVQSPQPTSSRETEGATINGRRAALPLHRGDKRGSTRTIPQAVHARLSSPQSQYGTSRTATPLRARKGESARTTHLILTFRLSSFSTKVCDNGVPQHDAWYIGYSLAWLAERAAHFNIERQQAQHTISHICLNHLAFHDCRRA